MPLRNHSGRKLLEIIQMPASKRWKQTPQPTNREHIRRLPHAPKANIPPVWCNQKRTYLFVDVRALTLDQHRLSAVPKRRQN